jgi:uncharacterized phage protein (TIGR01671 family)
VVSFFIRNFAVEKETKDLIMKREIKFRGKNSETKQWVCGDLLHVGNGFIITINSELGETLPNNEYIGLAYRPDEIAVVIPETIGQFTGLLDKNGNEIYEGDIVIFDNHLQDISHIVYDYSGFYVDSKNYKTEIRPTMNNHMIVVGNIYDNQELLKAETL